MSHTCPCCASPLAIKFNSISCQTCHMTGDPSFWAKLEVKARRGMRTNACAFCDGTTKQSDIGYLLCSRCGIEYDEQLGRRLEHMSPKNRAQYVGSYHAKNGYPYRWQYEKEGEERMEYARGWYGASIKTDAAKGNRWLWDAEAKRDARLWPWS